MDLCRSRWNTVSETIGFCVRELRFCSDGMLEGILVFFPRNGCDYVSFYGVID